MELRLLQQVWLLNYLYEIIFPHTKTHLKAALDNTTICWQALERIIFK